MSRIPDRERAVDPGSYLAPRRRSSWQAPRLRVGEEAGRHATWLELFFDLVFVVAIAALAGLLHDDLNLGGFFAFPLLFVPVGWAWMSFAYYAD